MKILDEMGCVNFISRKIMGHVSTPLDEIGLDEMGRHHFSKDIIGTWNQLEMVSSEDNAYCIKTFTAYSELGRLSMRL